MNVTSVSLTHRCGCPIDARVNPCNFIAVGTSLRPIALLVAVRAIALISASTGSVIFKDYEPRLDVQVKGVPGYIYYNRDYDLTLGTRTTAAP